MARGFSTHTPILNRHTLCATPSSYSLYLNFWLYSVHAPWNAKADLVEHYKKLADPKAAQRNPVYAGMVKSMDNAVGKLLDALDAAHQTDNSIVVFTSDNGEWAYPPRMTDPKGYEAIPATSNAPLKSGKASDYEGGSRIPCLVAWPGHTKPGTTSDALFSSVDWFPTLLAMTGVKLATKTDGVDQMPAILGGKSARDAVYVYFRTAARPRRRTFPASGPEPGSAAATGN